MTEREPTQGRDLSIPTQVGVFVGLMVPIVCGVIWMGRNIDTVRDVYHDLSTPRTPVESSAEASVRSAAFHAGELVLSAHPRHVTTTPDGEHFKAVRKANHSQGDQTVVVVKFSKEGNEPANDNITDVRVKVWGPGHVLNQAFIVAARERQASGETTWSIKEKGDGTPTVWFEVAGAADDLEQALQTAFPED